MDRLEGIKIFVRVVESGSFSAVARELGTGQPAISKQVAALEEHLGAQLLMRTSRSLSLTEAGSHVLDRLPMPIKHAKWHVARHQPPLSWRAAASAVSSGCVLNAMAALGAALWMAFTTISNSGKFFGGSLRPPPITTQS